MFKCSKRLRGWQYVLQQWEKSMQKDLCRDKVSSCLKVLLPDYSAIIFILFPKSTGLILIIRRNNYDNKQTINRVKRPIFRYVQF